MNRKYSSGGVRFELTVHSIFWSFYMHRAVGTLINLWQFTCSSSRSSEFARDAASPLWVETDQQHPDLHRDDEFWENRPTLQIVVEEGEGDLVAPFVLPLDPGVVQVRPRRHPAVDLVGEGLDVLGDLEICLVFLDVIGRLVLGREHAHGDLNFLGVSGVQHGRVDLDGGLELGWLARDQRDELSAPAVAHDAPDGDVGVAFGRFLHDVLDLGQVQFRPGSGFEEVAELLALLFRVGWVPCEVGGLALEEVRHIDLVLVFFVRVCKDVGAL